MSAITFGYTEWRRWLADFWTTIRLIALAWSIYWRVSHPVDEMFWWMFFLAVTVAGVTDYLDGRSARLYGSNWWGVLYDSHVDKLCFIWFALVICVDHPLGRESFEVICLAIMAVREVGMGIGRAFGGPGLFPVQMVGKVKMVVQFVALALYGVPLTFIWPIARIALFVATILTLFSLGKYLYDWSRKS